MLNQITPVVKNLVIINVLVFLAQIAMINGFTDSVDNIFVGHTPLESDMFKPWQIITHMFMHGSIGHLFFNMFALAIFGSSLERVWGAKRFLQFYIFCGIGAFVIFQLIAGGPNVTVIGASGAVYGLLLGFGMLFPNTEIMLLIPPIPIKAKYFVVIYGLLELFSAMSNNSDGIAHVAHLGGMIIGYILIKRWQKSRNNFY